MNFDYWKEFYKTERETEPSDFAKFCAGTMNRLDSVIDLGCGNGRDTYYLAKHAKSCMGVDSAIRPKANGKAFFLNHDLNKLENIGERFDYVYCRFLFHAIEEDTMWRILNASRGATIMTEFRVKGDKPKIYTNHKRREIDPYKLLDTLLQYGYSIEYFKVGRGMAKYKDEDPLVCRLICHKN